MDINLDNFRLDKFSLMYKDLGEDSVLPLILLKFIMMNNGASDLDISDGLPFLFKTSGIFKISDALRFLVGEKFVIYELGEYTALPKVNLLLK